MLVWLTLIHQQKTYLQQGLWIIPCPLFKVPSITETTKTCIWWNWRYSEQRSVMNIFNKQTTLTVGHCHGWFQGHEHQREWHSGTCLPRLWGDLWMSLWWLDGVDQVKGECGCQCMGSCVWMAEIMSSVASKSGRPETNEKLTTISLQIPCSSTSSCYFHIWIMGSCPKSILYQNGNFTTGKFAKVTCRQCRVHQWAQWWCSLLVTMLSTVFRV